MVELPDGERSFCAANGQAAGAGLHLVADSLIAMAACSASFTDSLVIADMLGAGAERGARKMARTIAETSSRATFRFEQAMCGTPGLPLIEGRESRWEVVKDHRGPPDATEGRDPCLERRTLSWAAPAGQQ